MQTIELFSGTGSFSKVAESWGFKTFKVELDSRFDSDLNKDIFEVQASELPQKPLILWASPPCTSFSVASIKHYWVNKKPKNKKTWDGIALVLKTLQLIKELKPKYWFIENPRGMLRNMDFMQEFHKNTVTYCQYGLDYMKPTDIWTNFKGWITRKPCKAGDSCHTEARRGSKTGVQGVWEGGVNNVKVKGTGLTRAQLRAVIPPELFKEIFYYIIKSELKQQEIVKSWVVKSEVTE